MLKVKVKASAVTNLTDARYFAAREVEWLGFQLEAGDERYISPDSVAVIKEWVDGVKVVGEFSFSKTGDIRALADRLGLDAVQVGMFAEIEELPALAGIPVIKEVIVDEETTETDFLEHLLDYSPFCDAFLLDFANSGITWEKIKRGIPFPKEVLKSACQHNRVIVNIELSSAIIQEFLSTIRPYGLNVTGGEEEKTGFKSFEELDEIFDLLEVKD
jgi:phosphoribosylanthranilate isomerase